MPIDYAEDFLETIKSISFGYGQWMVLGASIPDILGNVTIKVTLPDQSGGTPGWTLWLNKVPPPYPIGPLTTTAALLKSRVRTDAGASFTGFNERIQIVDRNYVRVWLKLDDQMPSSPFRVRFEVAFSGALGSFASLVVATVAKSKMKVGLSTGNMPQQSGGEVTTNSNVGSPFDFRVTPSSLLVVAPPSP